MVKLRIVDQPSDQENNSSFEVLAGDNVELLAFLREVGNRQSVWNEGQLCDLLFGGSVVAQTKSSLEKLPDSHWVVVYLQKRCPKPDAPLGIDLEAFVGEISKSKPGKGRIGSHAAPESI